MARFWLYYGYTLAVLWLYFLWPCVRQARAAAKQGGASAAVTRWLFPPKELRRKVARREKFAEFSDATPPVVLTRPVIDAAIAHLSRVDPKLEALIARIGAASLEMNIGTPKPP